MCTRVDTLESVYIGSVGVYRMDDDFYWGIRHSSGGNPPQNYTLGTINNATWYTIDFYVNVTVNGNFTLWVDEVLMCQTLGDYSSLGSLGLVLAYANVYGDQSNAKTVCVDEFRIDDDYVGSGNPIIFQSIFVVLTGVADEPEILDPLQFITINGTEVTDSSGFCEYGHLTYNTEYLFVIGNVTGYYPAWCLNVEGSFSWNGTNYLLYHTVFENQTGYIQISLFESSDPYINYSNAQLSSASLTSTSFSITAQDTGTKTINVSVADRGEPNTVSGLAGWSFDSSNNIYSMTVAFSSSQTVSLYWGSVVGTSLSSYATGLNYQRKTFYANGRFWIFYSDGQNMVFRSSTDGSTWGNSTVFESNSATGGELSLYFSGSHVHLAYRNASQTGKLNYQRGQPQSDGTITFDPFQELNQIGVTRVYITLDNDGYPWIASHNATHMLTWKSSLKNGSWTTDTGFPYVLSESDWTPIIVPYSNYMYLIYAEQGQLLKARRYLGGWGGEETISSSQVLGSALNQDTRWSLTSDDSTIHIAFPYETSIFHIAFDGNVWSIPYEVVSLDYPQTEAIFSMSGSVAYLFWEKEGIVYLKRYIDGWEQTKSWLSETYYKQTLTSSFTSHSNRIGLAWTDTSSPAIVKFAWFYTTASGNFLLEGYDGVTLSSIVYDALEGKLTFTSTGSGSTIVRGTDPTLTVTVNGSAWTSWSSNRLYITISALTGTSEIALYSVIEEFPSSSWSDRPTDVVDLTTTLIEPVVSTIPTWGLYVVIGGIGIFVVTAFYTKISKSHTRGIPKRKTQTSKPRGIQRRPTPRKKAPRKPKKSKRTGRFT